MMEVLQITLASARVNAGYSQEEACELIGVSLSTLKNWEASVTFPKQPQIEKICEVYGVKYDNIRFG